MNVAILIGVSDYVNLNELPACKNDLALVKGMAEKIGRFDRVLVLDDSQDSKACKDQLAKFITDIRGQVVEEVFFYFTGHGGLHGDDVLLKLKDYNKREPLTTSLSNAEIDTHLRSLTPNLAIKAIDACHSGVAYVKSERSGIEDDLKKGSAVYKRCYFMFSCESFQTSWQNSQYSYFTRSFCRAVLKFTQGGKEARYNEITTRIADDFSTDVRQKPIFVSQAHATEVFAHGSPELTEFLTDKLTLPNPSPAPPISTGDPTTSTPRRKIFGWSIALFLLLAGVGGIVFGAYKLGRQDFTASNDQRSQPEEQPKEEIRKGPEIKKPPQFPSIPLRADFLGESRVTVAGGVPIEVFKVNPKNDGSDIFLQVTISVDGDSKLQENYTLLIRDPKLAPKSPPIAILAAERGTFDVITTGDMLVSSPQETHFRAFFSLSSPLDKAAFNPLGAEAIVAVKVGNRQDTKYTILIRGYRIDRLRFLDWS